MIRTIIADDEPLARQGLRDLVAAYPDLEIVAECGDGRATLAALDNTPCELLLLDVQMPELNGFEVLQAMPAVRRPVTIFVTAHDAFALDAFRVHAIDYLTKPVQPQRFAHALERARAQIEYGASQQVLQRIEALVRSAGTARTGRIMIKSDGRSVITDPDEIERIEAEGNYARVFLRKGELLIRESLTDLERRLPADQFARVHRSHIVNLGRVQEIQPMFKGDFVVRLKSGLTVPLSRKYRPQIEARFGREL